jgi:hypothetical protein
MSTAIQSGFLRRRAVVCLCWGWMLAIPAAVWGQTNYYATNGAEYAIVGSMPGDQTHPDMALNTSGGFVVWQDNVTDGIGLGISAMRINSTLSGSGNSFRVNVQGAADQENPRVALLAGGGAVFVWQGGVEALNQHIYARFLSSGGIWLTPTDVLVNTITNNFQANPAVAVLTNGNIIVVWDSFNEAGSSTMLDVYGRILSPTGQPLTGEFLINQFTPYNQSAPTVAALANGGFVVAWVSEQERSSASAGTTLMVPGQMTHASVDVYTRLYDGNGNPQGGESLVNPDFNPCATPGVAAGSDGGFVVTWAARDMTYSSVNGLDIYARAYSKTGVGGTVMRINSYLSGDQSAPRINAVGTDYFIVWASQTPPVGVYGRFLHGDGSLNGDQFEVNTTSPGSQIQSEVASDGFDQFLVVWTGYAGSVYGEDLYGQRYITSQQPLAPLPAPFVDAPFTLSNGVYQPQLLVSWPPVTGLSVSNYEIYVDGSANPTALTMSNLWTMTVANNLSTNSTHSFQVDYTTTDGRKSPLSPSSSGTTWSGLNWGGIPYEWMAEFFGGYYGGTYHTSFWPSANLLLASGGPTLQQVFLSGGNPLDSTTWLRTTLSNTPEGLFLSWNTQPGFTYQVQSQATLGGAWTNLGSPRFAAGTTDSIYAGKSSSGYFRILLLR